MFLVPIKLPKMDFSPYKINSSFSPYKITFARSFSPYRGTNTACKNNFIETKTRLFL